MLCWKVIPSLKDEIHLGDGLIIQGIYQKHSSLMHLKLVVEFLFRVSPS